MRRKAERNATGLARRFSNLAGLKLLLSDELRVSGNARGKALGAFEELSAAVAHRPDTLVEQVLNLIVLVCLMLEDLATCMHNIR